MDRVLVVSLALALWLALLQYGVSASRLGESRVSYAVLDDAVRPYLIARMPLTGTSVAEWVAMTEPAYIKYGHVHRRRKRRKSRQRLPPTWFQRMVHRMLCTALEVRVQLLFLYVKFTFAVLLIRILLLVLHAKAHRKAIRLNHRFHQCLQSVVHCPLVLVRTLAGYASSVIEMLLMRSGDVEPNPGPCLTVCDLRTVVDAVWRARERWSEIGLELGISVDDLENIEGSDNGRRLERVLTIWLRRTDLSPSWTSLAKALRAQTVDRQDIADEIDGTTSVSPSLQQGTADVRSLPPSLQLYADYLKSVYSSCELPVYGKWPPTQSTCFISLAAISKEDITKEQADEFTRATLHGDVDQILKKKRPIKMEEVLVLESGEKPKVVLVEGGPGVGKTTFSWEVCKQWSKGQLFQEYSIIVLVRLRDEGVQNASEVTDLFYYSSKRLQEQIADDLLKGQGNRMLVILDGLDELPRSLLVEKSVFGQLLSGISLPLATVLVTSRPSVRGKLLSTWKSRVTRHVEVLGFTKQSIQDYARSVLSPQDLPKFEAYLSLHPHINTMMYIPLNSAIVIEVYKQSQRSGTPAPTTATQLYTDLSRTLLLRYLDDHSDYKGIELELNEFSDLPPTILIDFKRLCEIAYNGVIEQQLVFSQLGKSFNHLGFMHSSSEIFGPRRERVSYSFLHFSIQEYLAAVHVSLMDPELQMELCRKRLVHSTISDRFGNVCKFLFGITQLIGLDRSEVEQYLFRYSHLQAGQFKVFSSTIELLYETQSEQCISMLGDRESVVTRDAFSIEPSECAALANCIGHSQCSWRLSLAPNDDGAYIFAKELSEYDSSHAGHIETLHWQVGTPQFLPNILPHLQGMKKLLLENVLIAISLVESIASMRSLESLSLRNSTLSKDVAAKIVSQGLHLKITLSVINCHIVTSQCSSQLLWEFNLRLVHGMRATFTKLTAIGVAILSEVLCRNTYLKKLNISNSIFDSEGAQAFVGMLKTNRSLSSINVSKCSGVEQVQPIIALAVAEYLSQAKALTMLNISATTHHTAPVLLKGDRRGVDCIQTPDFHRASPLLNERAAPVLVDISPTQITIKRLPPEGFRFLLQFLHTNSTVEELNMSGSRFNPESARAFGAMLKVNQSLIKVNIEDCHIGDEEAQHLAEGLHHNTELQVLHMDGNPLGDRGVIAMLKLLFHNKTLHVLDIWPLLSFKSSQCASRLPPEGIVILSEFLSTNTSVKKLDISGSRFNPESARAFGAMLKVNQSLIKVNIAHCDIGDEEAQHLAEGLQHNTVLQELNMAGNFAGALVIVESLSHNKVMDVLHNNPLLYFKSSQCSLTTILLPGDIVLLSEFLYANTSVKELDISESIFNPESARAFGAMLKVNQSLIKVNIAHCHIGDEEAQHLAEGLQHNTVLQELNMAGNFAGARVIVESLSHNKVMDVLHNNPLLYFKSSQCSLTTRLLPGDIVLLSQFLYANTSVKELDMFGSRFNPESARAFGAMLKVNQSLIKVNIAHCHIGDEEAQHLAEGLHHNTVLKRLYMGKNPLGGRGVIAMLKLLFHNKTLHVLDIGPLLSFNSSQCAITTRLPPEGIVILSEFLSTNTSVNELDISGSRFNSESAQAFGAMLKVNQSLIKVNIAHCHIGDEGAQHLTEGLHHNTVLQELDMSHNGFRNRGTIAIAEMLKRNSTLKKLIISRPFKTLVDSLEHNQLVIVIAEPTVC